MENKKTWDGLSRAVDALGFSGEEFVSDMKELYSLYTPNVVDWLAGIYDSASGGFYYSNSARDNAQFLPDIESTNQATNYLLSSGLVKNCDELPEFMKAKIIAFCKSLQSPEDGYIYHPQWGKDITDHRRGRDLMWAESMRKKFRFDFDYPTALERLGKVAEKREVQTEMPSHLTSPERLIKYLDSYDWQDDAYFSGNAIAAQGIQIKAAGLSETVAAYLESVQDKKRGMWGKKEGYASINAYLKVSALYDKLGIAIPNTDRAIGSIIDCITSEEVCQSVCWQYNAWFSIYNIYNSMRKLGELDGIEKIRKTLLKRSKATLRATRDKVATFKKSDGSFSYKPHRTSPTAQGAPVALPDTNEGDMNATVICTGGILENVYRAFGLSEYEVPLFGKEEFERFISIIKSNEERKEKSE
ncbi:MAG: hypothetical protein IJ488_03135 [Clostridia bacterium]|nr:hypothetical protein [Clostridia bacterium]